MGKDSDELSSDDDDGLLREDSDELSFDDDDDGLLEKDSDEISDDDDDDGLMGKDSDELSSDDAIGIGIGIAEHSSQVS
jgi:hypothetical protein